MSEITKMINVFDRNGKCTDNKCTLVDAHSKGLWHNTVHVWCYYPDGKIILQKRANNSGTYSGLLDISTAGHIFSSSDELSTLKKEAKEELGIKINEKQLKKICTMKTQKIIPEFNTKDNEFNTIYLCKLDCLNNDFKLQKEEVDSIIKLDLKDFECELTYPDKYKKYVDHGYDYYSKIICAIKQELNNNALLK